MKKNVLILLFFLPILSYSQESNWNLDGYVKDLYMFYHPEQAPIGPKLPNFHANTIHNRLNFNWFATDKINFTTGIRNRLIMGNIVSDIPNYKSVVDIDNGYADLSWISAHSDKWFLHTIVDRAYIDYTEGDWQFRIGRQRINWGISKVWNPNDVFNSFSYFDFDYEERPGSDAINIRHYLGVTSSMELVFKMADNSSEMALAAMYRFSKWNYDFQLLSGWVGDDYMLGTGWSGDIMGGGFRGEISYFSPRSTNNKSKEASVASLSYDYTLPNSLSLSIEGLFNSKGSTKNAVGSNVLFDQILSAKMLSRAKYSIFGQAAFPVTPLFTASFSTIVNPSDHSYYLNPSFSYSLSENIELMLTTQLFFGKNGSEFGDIGQVVFGRLRWSF